VRLLAARDVIVRHRVYDLRGVGELRAELTSTKPRHGAMNPAGRVRIRNIMPISKGYSRASQSFLIAHLAQAFYNSKAWKDLAPQRDKAQKLMRAYAVEALK
jgi:hypothetical protein